MSLHKMRITSKQVDRLLADVRALPEEPAGEHLSDDEFTLYAMAMLTPEATSKAEAHLGSCPNCAAETERLLEASRFWESEKGAWHLSELANRTIPQWSSSMQSGPTEQRADNLRPIATSLQNLFGFGEQSVDKDRLAWAAEANTGTVRRVWGYSDSQSGIEGEAFLDSNRDLVIVFSSKQMEFQGRRLNLQISSEEEEVEQERTLEANAEKTEVGATFVIPRYQLPQEAIKVSLKLEEAES